MKAATTSPRDISRTFNTEPFPTMSALRALISEILLRMSVSSLAGHRQMIEFPAIGAGQAVAAGDA